MKYYVYVEKENGENKNQVFVDDLDTFVKEHYDPKCMSFTGVVIEASDVHVAKQAYDSPHESHVEATIAWIPEPPETANHSLIAQTEEQLELTSHMLRCSILAVKIANNLKECNQQLAELAYRIRIYNKKNPEIATEEVFNRIKARYIEHFQRLRYIPYAPPQE